MKLVSLTVLLIIYLCTSDGALKCSTTATGGSVINVTDGIHPRCAAIITPSSTKPMAVLFWFHGSGGSARGCGQQRGPEGKSWADYAIEQGFAFVCGEALQYDRGGFWDIPEIITNDTGTPCESKDSMEVDYMKNIVKVLQQKPEIYDTKRIFTAGCSMGSAFSLYSSECIRMWYPNSISSFMTHSTGLKIKGDGLNFPKIFKDTNYSWGECPACEYFPARIPTTKLQPSMKACIFDNTGDPREENPYFYKSSLQLEKAWKAAGNRCESSYGIGGHCVFHSFAAILNCLDDGTRRLLPNGTLPTLPPTPSSPTPSPPPTPGVGPSPECIKVCNEVCPNLEGKGEPCAICLKQHKWDKVMTENCEPTPWTVTLDTFCNIH